MVAVRVPAVRVRELSLAVRAGSSQPEPEPEPEPGGLPPSELCLAVAAVCGTVGMTLLQLHWSWLLLRQLRKARGDIHMPHTCIYANGVATQDRSI